MGQTPCAGHKYAHSHIPSIFEGLSSRLPLKSNCSKFRKAANSDKHIPAKESEWKHSTCSHI